MKKLAIGIDIGGTNTAFGIVDSEGKVLCQGSIITQTHKQIEDFIKELSDSINEKIKEIDGEFKIVGIGIGAPNGNYYSGCIENAANLRWQGKISLTKLFAKYYSQPVFVTNDANAAAIGEMVYGGAKGMKNFIVITLGTGLGSGIIVNGDLLYGHDGFAGEVGHIIVTPDGRDCGCGRQGCLETYVSATGVVRTAYKLLADHSFESELRHIPYYELTAKNVAEAARRGDKIALETFEQTGKMLGKVLADVVAITSPEAIFLFGGLTKAGNLLFDPVQFHLEKNMLNIFKNKVKLLPSKLDDSAAILGSSALVWNELAKNQK
jgi:glucokinase